MTRNAFCVPCVRFWTVSNSRFITAVDSYADAVLCRKAEPRMKWAHISRSFVPPEVRVPYRVYVRARR